VYFHGLHVRSGNQAPKDTKSQHLTVEAGILGVLGLLLGFTMSMALTRFEIRKHLVLEEAQAIRAAHLLTQLLPVEEGKEIADLLRAYTNVRVRGEDGRNVYEQIAAARQESSRLQDAFWHRAVAYGKKDPNPVRSGLLLQSLKEVIQLDAARWMAFQDQVPATVIYAIAVVGLLAVHGRGLHLRSVGTQAALLDLHALASDHVGAGDHRRRRQAPRGPHPRKPATPARSPEAVAFALKAAIV